MVKFTFCGIEISQYFIFQDVKPAHLEFTVKGDLFIEPDGAFLLEGGKAHLRLFEKSGLRDSAGELIKRGMNSKICLTGDTIRHIRHCIQMF